MRLTIPVRVAVVGAGYFGDFHLDAWSRMPEVELVGLCDADAARAKAMAERYGVSAVFTDAAHMAETLKPDIVDIAAPPAAHLPTIRAVAPHGKAIICQKPFCGALAAAREAVALCEAAGVALAVHENIRYQPWHLAAKRLIDAGALGVPRHIAFHLRPGDGRGPRAYLDRQPYFQTMPRFLVHETAIHWIDLFRHLMGEATGVFARLKRRNPVIQGEDAGMILFDFASGATGLFDADRCADHKAENPRRTMGEMRIEGDEATLRLDGDGRLWLRPFGSAEERPHDFVWRDHHFGGDCVHACNLSILSAWLDGAPAPTNGRGYLRNQEIEEAVYDSAASGVYRSIIAAAED